MSAPGSADILEAKPWSDVHLESAQNTPVDWNLCKVSSSEHKWLKNSSLVHTILYSGKLSREKIFANFAVLWLLAKLFSLKFGSVVSFSTAKARNLRVFSTKIVLAICEFSPQNLHFSPIHESFLPQKFPTSLLYSTTHSCETVCCPACRWIEMWVPSPGIPGRQLSHSQLNQC